MRIDQTSPLYAYDPKLGRHRNKQTGRIVSLSEIKAQTQKIVDYKVAEVATLGRYLLEQKLDLSAWQLATAETIKTLNLQFLLLERGGLQNITVEDYLAVGRNLKSEYRYLGEFAQQIQRGEVSQKQFYARLAKFTKNTRVVLQIAKRQNAILNQGMQWARRSLGANHNHCPDCPRYAGVFPASLVVMPGERCVCGSDCKCPEVEFFAEDPRDEA